jgi:hypothetical protein
MKNNDVRDGNGTKMPGGVNWTPMPAVTGALPGGRGLQPTVVSDSPAQVGQGIAGHPGVTPAEASGRQQINALPAQGSVAQGPAPSSLERHAIVSGVVADHPKPEQSGVPGKNDKGVGFYG